MLPAGVTDCIVFSSNLFVIVALRRYFGFRCMYGLFDIPSHWPASCATDRDLTQYRNPLMVVEALAYSGMKGVVMLFPGRRTVFWMYTPTLRDQFTLNSVASGCYSRA